MMRSNRRDYCLFAVVLTLFLTFASLQAGVKSSKNEVAIESVELKVPAGTLYGTLMIPASTKPPTVVLMISGSGPTDRDGNSALTKNNAYRLLADSMAAHGIASLRYDKRGIAASSTAMSKEEDLRFEDYVNDAAAWANLLNADKRFSRVVVMGHSEGSLIGMIAAQRAGAKAFVSLEGASETADAVLRRQFMAAPGGIADLAFPILDSLTKGKIVEKAPPMLAMVFRPSVQPYLISWFKYDPAKEIAKLGMPILVVQGTTDLQTLVADGEALAKANSHARLAIIEGMNHVLKLAEADRMKNIATYKDPGLPLAQDLITRVLEFLQQ